MSRLRVILTLLVFISNVQFILANNKPDEGQIELAMRMIGHQMLLHAGDSASQVLPIQQDSNRYQIPFKTPFIVFPDTLVKVVSDVFLFNGISSEYRVELLESDSSSLVYGYQIGGEDYSSIIPCLARELPMDKYTIQITLLDKKLKSQEPVKEEGQVQSRSASNLVYGILALLFFSGFVFFYVRKNKRAKIDDRIKIGQFRLDKRRMKLFLGNEHTELSSKETDLLVLLHSSANNTLEREEILKQVWNSNGEYVGRTLDVFVSKLRKKLEADPNVKIANVRGVGYKLVMDEAV